MKDSSTIGRIVLTVARRYARTCWWADMDDLTQAGWEAALDAAPRYDPNVGVAFEAFIHGAAWKGCSRYLWGESSPCSGGWHRPAEQRTQQRAPLGEALAHASMTPEEEYRDRAWRASVRARLAELADPIGAAVLLDEMTSAEAAAVFRVTVGEVYRRTAVARCAISEDCKMWDLLDEREEW